VASRVASADHLPIPAMSSESKAVEAEKQGKTESREAEIQKKCQKKSEK
jgi:hypothetical protein